MNKNEWIDEDLLRQFESDGTNAHRLCTIDAGWVERFGADILISFRTETARDQLVSGFNEWATSVGFSIKRVFGRFLPRKNEEREKPKLISGSQAQSLQTAATENRLKFGLDFGAGYSVGLFVDPREKRWFVRQARPKRLLNCFAYTCSFAVAAASAGAHTANIDLSKKSLKRGRQNFFLDEMSTGR